VIVRASAVIGQVLEAIDQVLVAIGLGSVASVQ
jgi:hypothetical protein